MKTYKSLLTLVVALLIPLFLTSCFGSDSDDDKTVEQIDEAQVNLLFDSMMVQLERMYNAEDMDAITSENFSKMATDFKTVINSDPTNMKAGVGYIVSSMANLNSNVKLKEIADSMDSYITAMDAYWSDGETMEGTNTQLFSKAYRTGGVDGLGMAILAQSPKMMRGNGTMPSFPKMITIGKIQELIESEIMPVLDGVIDVVEGLEDKSDNSLTLTFEEDTFEIDMGEIYLADASLRILRHSLLFLTAYNYDVKTPDGQDLYAVVDKFMKLEDEGESTDKVVCKLSNDTLYKYYQYSYSNDVEFYSYMYDLINYNMITNTSFLKLQRQNHTKMHTDIKMVPEKIKKAIAFITAEGDDQEDDLLKIADIDELTAEMVDVAADMELEGISPTFAANFKSPTALADYMTQVLTGPVTFNETIDGVTFNYRIDFSQFYTNPVQNFKDWFPYYKMNDKTKMMYEDTSDWGSGSSSGFPQNSFYVSEYYTVEIDQALVDSAVANDWGGMTYYLKSSFNYEIGKDIDQVFMPIVLTDVAGNTTASTYDEIEEALFDAEKFPHFKDYTFNKIFPDMTRQKWYELFQNLDELFSDDDGVDDGTN